MNLKSECAELLIAVLEGEEFFDGFEHLGSMRGRCEIIQQSKGFLHERRTARILPCLKESVFWWELVLVILSFSR
jgi:hypothetical protein